ncbi:MAG TPA: prepilin-type N-terminal cleavage/methylation domain-containing protein [Pyrinomonadaceae bacterium]|nr:prepilin-type N-terminal cleavage/methylation domain-containing protein [Pyrinomonadaceae bacterium]
MSRARKQDGFSLLELLVAMGLMLVITGATMTMLRDSIRFTSVNYELAEAQESLRTSQEYINRDLLSAGQGLSGINTFNIAPGFITNYLTTNSAPGFSMIASDDNVAAGTSVLGTNPAVTVRSSPNRTDRLTILEQDQDPTLSTYFPTSLGIGTITFSGNNATAVVPTTPNVYGYMNVGEIYCITSGASVTFVTVTGKVSPNQIQFNSDTYGLNKGALKAITDPNGTGKNTSAASLMRMKVINYFVDSNGLLIRRTFGVKGAGFTDDVIAEHIVDLQFRYITKDNTPDGIQQLPVTQLSNGTQQTNVRLVETTVTTETVHSVVNGNKQQLTMTATTGIRNMQFRRADQ